MTREEAIHELQEDKKLYETEVCYAGDGSPDGRLLEALDMAIEALSVANLKEEFESAVPNCKKCAIKELWKATEKEDLVEVVRCKDCRHGEHIQIPLWENRDIDKAPSQFHDFIKCHKFHIKGFNETLYLGDDDFCSYGEKRK